MFLLWDFFGWLFSFLARTICHLLKAFHFCRRSRSVSGNTVFPSKQANFPNVHFFLCIFQLQQKINWMNILKFLPLNFVLWDLNKWINNELMSSRKPASSYIIKKSDFILKLKSSPTRAKNISQSKNQGIKSIALDSYHYYKKVSSYLGLHFLLLLPSVVIEVDIDKEALLLCLWLNFPATEKREKIFSIGKHIIGNCRKKSTEVFFILDKSLKLVSFSLYVH